MSRSQFDPVSTADYYSLAGVFASTVQAPRPLKEIDADAETRFMVDSQRFSTRAMSLACCVTIPDRSPRKLATKCSNYRAEMEALKEANAGLRETSPGTL